MRAWLSVTAAVLLSAGCSCDFFDSGDVDAGPRNGGVGDPCFTDTGCRSGLVCDDTNRCAPSGTGVEGSVCVLSGDCMDGLFCGPRRVCEAAGDGADGDDCQGTADCQQGLLCTVEGFGYRCRAAGDGDLSDPCGSDVDCLAGLACVVGDGGARTCQNPAIGSGDAGAGRPPLLPPWTGADCVEDAADPPRAYFEVPRGDDTDGDFYRLPFPNDVRRTATGLDLTGHPRPATALPVDVLGRTIAAAEQDLDGFATNPVVFFRFSRPYEWGDVNGDRVRLVDVTPGSPEFGRDLGRGWLTTAGPITRYICPNWLSVRRGHGAPLRPGTTYALILLDGIRTDAASGNVPFEPSPDLEALLGDTAPTGAPLDAAWDRYQLLRDWLAQAETPAVGDVLNAAVFTTQRATDAVPALRNVIRGGPAPSLSDVTVCADGVASPCDDGGLRACGPESSAYWEIHARVALPQFQQGTPPFETPEDGGGIEYDASGAPVVARSEDVCMVMTVPKVPAAPAEGFPVLFWAHGTGGAFTAPIGNGFAEDLATADGGAGPANAVTVAIDMPQHGSRRGASTRDPDGLVFNFANPRAARDNFLQGAADLLALVYWAEGYVLPAAEAPTDFDVRFDPARFAILGHSQGASHASLMVPYEPGVLAVLLSGLGGDLTESLLTKTRPVNIARAVPLALLDPDRDGNLTAGANHPALALIQMLYEPVDAVNYGRHYHREPIDMRGRHVMMTFGLGDSFSTERTMAAFARSASLPQVSPELVDIGLGDALPPPVSGNVTVEMTDYTVGLRQYEPETGRDGHHVLTEQPQTRGDALRFLLQALAGATPTIGE